MIDRVKKQYNEYPYPEPIDDLKSQIEKGYREQSDLKISWPILFPEKKYRDDINIFIDPLEVDEIDYHDNISFKVYSNNYKELFNGGFYLVNDEKCIGFSGLIECLRK